MSQLLEDAPFDVSKITLSKKESEATEAPSEPSLSSRPTSLTEDLDPADAVAELAKCRAEIKELQAQLCGLREQYEPASTSFTKADGTFDKSDEIPAWVDKFSSSIEGMKLSEDFKGDSYRSANKFKGLDYCHSPTSALKLSEYRLYDTPDTNWIKVEAVVHFSANAEGAKSWVHRGALCALMDDAANWAGYCVSGNLNLFSGFTRSVFTEIKRPVRVGAVLKLIGHVQEVQNRTDVVVRCSIVDPAYNNALHCTGKCVFVMNEAAAEALESLVEKKQKKKTSAAPNAAPWDAVDATGKVSGNSWDAETQADPLFRPPNRVGRYGLGTRIDGELAAKIDESKIRGYVPSSGSLIKSAEKNSVKVKQQKEEQRRQLEDERERERAKNHPARKGMWSAHSNPGW